MTIIDELKQIINVLHCLPDDEEFSLLNTILEKDKLYGINDNLLKSTPLFEKDFGRFVNFKIINCSLLLTDKKDRIWGTFKKDKIVHFIKYLNDATYEITIRADFLHIMGNIMESDDAEEIWDNYKKQIIEGIRECSDWRYNDSDVRIAISRLLKAKLLNE